MSGRDVCLDTTEMARAAHVGVVRQLSSLARQSVPRFPYRFPGEAWARHIEGACGELAFAKFLGTNWTGHSDVYAVPDVTDYEVRTSQGLLKISPKDPDARKYALVVGSAPNFTVVGWCYGWEGKQEKWKSDPGGFGAPAYFVPQESLRGWE